MKKLKQIIDKYYSEINFQNFEYGIDERCAFHWKINV